MPILSALARKRAHSPTKPSALSPISKVARTGSTPYDGPGSHRSAGSTTSTHIVRLSVRDRVKRGMSNMKTKFLVGGRERDLDDLTGVSDQDSSVIITRQDDPEESAPAHVYSAMDQVEYHPYLKLVSLPESLLDDVQEDGTTRAHSNDVSPETAALCSKYLPRREEMPCVSNRPSVVHPTHRSSSARELHTKISQRIQQALDEPTIVHRPQWKRSSIQQPPLFVDIQYGHDYCSSPSTGQDDSDSSKEKKQASTPATSDMTTLSPSSTRHHSNPNPVRNDSQGMPSIHAQSASRFNPSQNHIPSSPLTIKTVEATAIAKILLETHYNSILHKEEARGLRALKLEEDLRDMEIPIERCQRARSSLVRHESNRLRYARVQKNWLACRKGQKGVSLADFDIVKILGKGSFGVVRLVKERSNVDSGEGRISARTCRTASSAADLIKQATAQNNSMCSKLRYDTLKRKKQVYAMKVIRKSEMVRNCQEGHLRAERDFLVAAEGSRWIIPLLAAFQDEKFLYLVMDYCIGGDFLGLLIRRDILCEEVTKWYVAEMILCVEEAHRMKWIHRDVKPDNFLIGADGHLKISDFGLAFDGEWQHDQKYFHNQRHDLLERLSICLRGDDLDEREEQAVDNSRRLAGVTGNSTQKQDGPSLGDEPAFGEPLLDWRNRVQKRRAARSVVGTSQYMAPEIIRGDAYDGRCD